MAVAKKQSILNEFFAYKNGILVDLLVVAVMFILNLVYLVPFLGEPDKSNIFSAPLIPFISRLLNFLLGVEKTEGVVYGLSFFIFLGPIFLYFLAHVLTKRRIAGFFSSLVFSLPLGWFAKGRIRMAFLIGDGGHIVALSLLPLASLFVYRFLKNGKFFWLVLASFGLGLIALASPFGLFIGIISLLIIAFSEFLQGQARLKLVRFFLFLLVTMGVVAFWYNPAFLWGFLKSQQGFLIRKTFVNLIPVSFVVLPSLAVFGFLLFEKKPHLQPLFIALGWVILFSLISFAGYVGSLLPGHPHRYLPEFGFSLSFLIGTVAYFFSNYLLFKGEFFKVNLSPLGRQLAQKAFWLASIGLTAGITFFSYSSLLDLKSQKVLGTQDQEVVARSLWGNYSSPIRYFGYFTSIFTLFLLLLLWFFIARRKQKG